MSQQVPTFDQFREVMRQLYDAQVPGYVEQMDPDKLAMNERATYETFIQYLTGERPPYSEYVEVNYTKLFAMMGERGSTFDEADEEVRSIGQNPVFGSDEYRRETTNAAARRALDRAVAEGGIGLGDAKE